MNESAKKGFEQSLTKIFVDHKEMINVLITLFNGINENDNKIIKIEEQFKTFQEKVLAERKTSNEKLIQEARAMTTSRIRSNPERTYVVINLLCDLITRG